MDGTILESLIQHNIFREIKIYDYQAICLSPENENSDAGFLLTVKHPENFNVPPMINLIYTHFGTPQPFKMMAWLFNAILGQIAWCIIHFELRTLWNPDWTYAFPQEDPAVASTKKIHWYDCQLLL